MSLDKCLYKFRVLNRDALRLQKVRYLDNLTVLNILLFSNAITKAIKTEDAIFLKP